MHLSLPHTPHVPTSDALRVRAISRRASVSDSVARLVAEMAFQPDRDRAPILPAILTGAQ